MVIRCARSPRRRCSGATSTAMPSCCSIPFPSDLEDVGAPCRGQLPGAGHHAPRRRMSEMATTTHPTRLDRRLRHLRPRRSCAIPIRTMNRHPRVGMPDRAHRTVGWFVDAHPVRRHRRHRARARHLHVAQHHRGASADRAGRGAVRRRRSTTDHLRSARIITGIAARSCRRSRRRLSPSTRTARVRCATN